MEKENFDLENFPASDSAKRMLGYVSGGFYDKSYVGKWLYQVMGLEYDTARENVEELPAQFFPETATWGLMYHEIKWGLPVRENLSYEERRRLIYEKRDYRAPMTPYCMEKHLAAVTGGEVHIADANDAGKYGFVPPHPNVFKAYFIGDGLDIKKVKELLNRLKQSHTSYTVNNRFELMADSRALERVRLGNIQIWIALWHICGGPVSIWHNFGLRCMTVTGTGLHVLKNRWQQSVREGITAGITAVVSSDVASAAEVSLTVHTGIISSYETVTLTVETKTKDWWCLDGAVSLDGARKLNAVYRKETAE